MINSRHNTIILIFICSLSACAVGGLVSVDDPDGEYRELHSDYVKSKSGAVGMYYSSLHSLKIGFSALSQVSALMTDEIQPIRAGLGLSAGPAVYNTDQRYTTFDEFGSLYFRTTSSSDAYINLHSSRIKASQARTLLRSYGDSSSIPFIANSYAIEGFAIALLAELFCSGIPLTSIPFEGSVEYTAGYSTDSLFTIASILFDSALSLNHDSSQFYMLAYIGKGRVSLSLGRFNEALESAEKAAGIGSSFALRYSGSLTPGTELVQNQFWIAGVMGVDTSLRVENEEGGVGLKWIADDPANQDIRIPLRYTAIPSVGYLQEKFVNPEVSVVIADWTHAKMIQAEAILNIDGIGGTGWLSHVNEARGRVGLSDTTDPGSFEKRIDLIFRERAFWFWLTGTRQGDMRRLVRQYGRSPYSIYPNGVYEKETTSSFYGDAFVLAPPSNEISINRKYKGCDDSI